MTVSLPNSSGPVSCYICFPLLYVILWAAIMPMKAQGSPSSYIWGAGAVVSNNDILWYDPVTEFSSVFSPTGIVSSLNGLALDRDREMLFFAATGDPPNYQERGLYYMDLRYNVSAKFAPLTDVGIVSNETKAIPQNACWYKGSYWFIVTETLLLRRAILSFDGNHPTGVAVYSDYNIGAPPEQASFMKFGGIDVDVFTDILYATTTRGQFFTIDLTNLAAPALPFNDIVPVAAASARPSLQIAFNVAYTVLYGQYQVDGTWYTINKSTGALTTLSFTVPPELSSIDISGALPYLGTKFPTTAPSTQRPTFAPSFSPSSLYTLVGQDLTCKPDVVVNTLADPPTAESCYQACLRRLGPETAFVFSIYHDTPESSNSPMICGCCLQCVYTEPSPGSQVFATSCDPPLEIVDSPEAQMKIRAGHDTVTLKYKVRNKGKFALGNAGFQLQVPESVSILEVSTCDGVDPNLSQEGITWWPLYFNRKQSLTFRVKLGLRGALARDGQFMLTGMVFERPLTEGIPTCVGPWSSSTVTVKGQ